MIKKLNNILFLVLTLGFSHFASGQELRTLAVEGPNSNIQSDTVLLIGFLPLEPNFCGLHVEWGDGTAQDYRLERAGSEPIKLSKRYTRVGDFTVIVKGKLLIRGLKTAVACKGEVLSLPIKVSDIEQQRQKAEIERINDQLKNEAAKSQLLELRLREEQLKQKELAIKQKEEELLKQKIQAELEANRVKEEAAKKSAAEKKSDQSVPIPRRQF